MEFESEECDYDIYGDTRNRKGKKEEGYTSHNKGYKEQKRIYYVKQKRLAQSLADREISEEEYNEEENKKTNRGNEKNLDSHRGFFSILTKLLTNENHFDFTITRSVPKLFFLGK